MQPAPKFSTSPDFDQDISRLRNLFASSFYAQDEYKSAISSDLPTENTSPELNHDEDFDWAITLGNIRELTDRAKLSEALVQAAEARAVGAEAKAKEAEHWLRVLHKAVLEGLPQRLAPPVKGD